MGGIGDMGGMEIQRYDIGVSDARRFPAVHVPTGVSMGTHVMVEVGCEGTSSEGRVCSADAGMSRAQGGVCGRGGTEVDPGGMRDTKMEVHGMGGMGSGLFWAAWARVGSSVAGGPSASSCGCSTCESARDIGGVDVVCGMGGVVSLREARVACIRVHGTLLELAPVSLARECDGCDAYSVFIERALDFELSLLCWR